MTAKTGESEGRMDPAMPIQYLKGVGPRRAEAFEKLGVVTVGDLLEYYPREWNFMPEPCRIADVAINEQVCITGIIEQTEYQPYRRKPVFKARVADDTGMCTIVWFHGGYLQKTVEPGKVIIASGKVTMYKHQLQMANPKFVILDENNKLGPEYLAGPVYPATAGLSADRLKSIVVPAVMEMADSLEDFFDERFRSRNELMRRSEAFRQIHNPDDEDVLARARRTLKYHELFLMQLGLALRRYRTRHFAPAVEMKWTAEIDRRIRKRFPFLLTPDQEKVIEEIVADMAKSVPMNRLLQGDVGSGKTVVALYAALLAVAGGTQAAIMAPTEILASQHMVSIERFLRGSRVRRELITGGLTGKKRAELTDRIKSGQVDIVVGTVALLQEDIEFANLGLVIIDEQHKFGVHQRAMLRKDKSPHCLVMTATPIPRTLAMTAFGDLDVAVIKHSPPGRGQIITRWVQPHDRQAAYEFIRQRLRAKKQAYFVYPRIDTDITNGDIKDATSEHRRLCEVFSEFNVALLHGQMRSEEKERVMKDFRTGRIDALVSTVVIEVGIDVPNATIMVIENANNFGLAQLHQLRGRIGRGQSRSYCLLFCNTDEETAKSRLEIMTRSNDGFQIAEHDLKLRGPGELFSTRQHGLPDLKIADIVDDFALLNLARKDAFALVEQDPTLSQAQHRNIRKVLVEKFAGKLDLGDIG